MSEFGMSLGGGGNIPERRKGGPSLQSSESASFWTVMPRVARSAGLEAVGTHCQSLWSLVRRMCCSLLCTKS